MTHFLPSCAEAARRVSEQHDAPLGGSARIGLWLHLALCAHCRRYSGQIRFLRSSLAHYPDRLAHVSLPEQRRAKIIRELSDSR